jgi:hypothetical protein
MLSRKLFARVLQASRRTRHSSVQAKAAMARALSMPLAKLQSEPYCDSTGHMASAYRPAGSRGKAAGTRPRASRKLAARASSARPRSPRLARKTAIRNVESGS